MVKYTKKQLKEIETIIGKKLENLEDLKIEEIDEIIFVEQIELGEIEEANFYEAETEMGVPYIKKGRIPLEEVLKIAPKLFEFLKYSNNPKTSIKDGLKMKTKEGLKNINGKIEKSRKIREKDKKTTIERNEKIHEEIQKLIESNVNYNKSLLWTLYFIGRGEKRTERFEEDGKDIELLKIQNSFINDESLDEIKELRSEYYENN